MCGIAGFVSAGGVVANGQELLQQFERSLYHRGPDDQGSVLTAGGRVGLTATRLAILDLSPAGHQPMRSADGRHVIAFNGEIYNFRALRAQLIDDGYSLRSNGDTEVVLELFRRDGPSCVEKLRGMFAFAIWSEDEESCFLARDPLGIKPLYYYQGGGELLAFASELKPLIRSGLVPKKLNPAAVQGYFRSGSVPEPETLIQDVRMFEAGSWMMWRKGDIAERRKYWELNFGGLKSRKGGREEEENIEHPTSNAEHRSHRAADIVRTALLDSIEHHFVSDVPVGLFLSGGIDSTALLALSHSAGRTNLQTFSVGSEEPEFNESDVAARTAQHFHTDHSVMQLEGSTARGYFGDFLQNMDQPSVDGFNTFTVSRFAKAQGMKVVLSGLGGDELFGGYASFTQVPKMLAMSRRLNALAPVRSAVGRVVERTARSARWQRLGEFLTQEPTAPAAFATFRGIFTEGEANALAIVASGEVSEDVAATSAGNFPTLADEISALEISTYMRNQLLRDSDVMSMANELELRVPFVDRDFVDTVTSIPAAARIRTGKKLLLEAVPEIPRWVALAPKRGFRFPFEKWVTEDWTAGSTLASEAGVRPRTWYQRWTIFVFEEWVRGL